MVRCPECALKYSQQTHNVETTSLQRRCNVVMLQRRCKDVVSTLCVYWDRFGGKPEEPFFRDADDRPKLFARTCMSESKGECGKRWILDFVNEPGTAFSTKLFVYTQRRLRSACGCAQSYQSFHGTLWEVNDLKRFQVVLFGVKPIYADWILLLYILDRSICCIRGVWLVFIIVTFL